jgi:hypothetical protein
VATIIWRGDAATVAQVDTITFSAISDTDYTTFTINGKDIRVTATASTVTQTTFGALCATTIGQYSNTIPEFAEVSATSNATALYITGPTDGTPFTLGVVGTNMTATPSTSTAASSPNHASIADNWSGGAVPGTGDTVIFENSDVDCLYGLDAITGDTLAALRIKASYTGDIGLPTRNENGTLSYYEYRDTQLQLGATLVFIGEGEGPGSQRINLDLEAVASEVIVYNTADAADASVGAVSLVGSNAGNVVRVAKGSVGLATQRETDTMVCATLECSYDTSQDSDSAVIVGRGTTLTAVKVYGGEHIINADLTTLVQDGGTVRLMPGVSPGTSIDIRGGVCYYDSDGTLTQGYVSDGAELIFGKFDARTVTNLTIYAGATVRDTFKTVTWSNPIVLTRCSIAEVTLDLGVGITLAPA